jgi:hypothetical protein
MFALDYQDAIVQADIILNSLDDLLNNSLLIGNGDINALVYQQGDRLLLHMTKNDVWDARLDTSRDPPLMSTEELKEKVKALGSNAPQGDLSRILQPEEEKDSYHAHSYPCPRLCGRLFLDLNVDEPFKGGYHRLSLSEGMIKSLPREGEPLVIFACANRNVFAIHRPRSAFKVSLDPVDDEEMPPADLGESERFVWVVREIPGDLDIAPLKYAVAVYLGESRSGLITVAIVTSNESNNPLEAAMDLAEDAAMKGFEALSEEQRRWWNGFWDKSGVKLADGDLNAMWYRNLYFLACVSRPGKLSPGLFASLIDNRPAWHGDYHMNYNIQQTFWGAYPSNHPELAEPYYRLVFNYLPRARWLARKLFDLEGAYYPHVLFAYEPSDPEGCRSRNGRQYLHFTWGRTLGVTAFTVQNLWWHYLYTMDEDFLREICYPVLREAADFYANLMYKTFEEEGTWDLYPTVSPEHWGITRNFERNRNCTFDIALAKFILQAAVQASQILKTDERSRGKWRGALDHLPSYPTSEDDDPVIVDVEGAPPITYNIPIPAFPVFPGEDVTYFSGNAEKELLSRSIERMSTNGNNSYVITAIAKARLSLPSAYKFLKEEGRLRTRPNGVLVMNRLEPKNRFNDFGLYTEMFGVVMAVSELLIQSVGGIIRLFPAWPKELDAEFWNLRTVGGFLLSAKLKDGEIQKVEVLSTKGGKIHLLKPEGWKRLKVIGEGGRQIRWRSAENLIEFQTEKGGRYKVVRDG